MKKAAQKYANVSQQELVNKRNELVREITKARVSMDASGLQNNGGLPGAQRELKAISRHLAVSSEKK